jgi:hypothetical protein
MKLRSDFVTNSSSVSFVALGPEDGEKIIEDIRKRLLKDPEIKKKFEESKWADDLEEYVNDDLCELIPVPFKVSGYDEYNLIGISVWDIIGNPEFSGTMDEVREKVAKKFNDTFGTKLKGKDITSIEESWYGG